MFAICVSNHWITAVADTLLGRTTCFDSADGAARLLMVHRILETVYTVAPFQARKLAPGRPYADNVPEPIKTPFLLYSSLSL